MDRINLKRSTPIGKELTWQSWMIERISIPIEIWEHSLEKEWNEHWLRSNSNTTTKTNKGFGLKNSQKQTYDDDFVWNFHGKAHMGLILQRPSWQGSVHDYERPRIVASYRDS
jgi:hypothetical protein